MVMFSSSDIQQMIAENSEFVSDNSLRRAVDDLNSRSSERILSQEWETAWLNGLSKVGLVRHEDGTLAGTTRPDIFFASREHPDNEFVADVATVSDQSLHQANPIEAFISEIQRIASKYNLRIDAFSVSIEGYFGREFQDRKRLKISKQHDFARFVFKRTDFINWMVNCIPKCELHP